MRYVSPPELLGRVITTGGRLLCLNASSKFIGWALAVPPNGAFHGGSISRKDHRIGDMETHIRELISDHKVEGIIVGYNYRRGVETLDVTAKAFVDDLYNIDDMNYSYWNKSFSTLVVGMALKRNHISKIRFNRLANKHAAIDILDEYVDHIKIHHLSTTS